MIFKHADHSCYNIILYNSISQLLYSVNIPYEIHYNFIKKTNKTRKTTYINISKINPNIRNMIYERLFNNDINYEFNHTIPEYIKCDLYFTFQYVNNTYIEQEYTIKITASFVQDYLTLPSEIIENLSMISLYKHMNIKYEILKQEFQTQLEDNKKELEENISHGRCRCRCSDNYDLY